MSRTVPMSLGDAVSEYTQSCQSSAVAGLWDSGLALAKAGAGGSLLCG